jgi:The  BURPS668_1122 family of deaminases
LPGGEQVITAGSKTFGDSVIVVLDNVGGKISALERDNPRTADALSFTLGLLVSGPVGAVGDVVVGKAVEAELARNKAARDGLTTVVNEVGLRATNALSSTTLERDRESAEFGQFQTENNVLKAGATVLGIGTIAKLLRKAGDIIPGGGINPNAGDVPRVEVPHGPPTPDFNRINAFVDSAPNRIAELRGTLTNRNGARTSGTVAVADVDIPGVPSELAGHTRVSGSDGFVGTGSESLPFTSELTAANKLTRRNVDAEYRILDNIADRLGNNPNAAGRVTIFVEIAPCNSCANVALTEFRRRYPNVQVDIKFNGTRIAPAPRVRPGG